MDRNEEFVAFLEGSSSLGKIISRPAKALADLITSSGKVAKKSADDVGKTVKKSADDVAEASKKTKKAKKPSKVKKLAKRTARLGTIGAIGDYLLSGEEGDSSDGRDLEIEHIPYVERKWPTNFYNPDGLLNGEQMQVVDSAALFGGDDIADYIVATLKSVGAWNAEVKDVAEKRYDQVRNYWNSVYSDGIDIAYDNQMEKGIVTLDGEEVAPDENIESPEE